MDEAQLAPVATILNDAYLATWAYSRSFRDDYSRPPTFLAKVHHMRSIVQIALLNDSRYELGEDFIEFGRIEFLDCETGRTYLLRSHSANSIEQVMLQRTFFDPNAYFKTPVVMLVYRFHRLGLDLAVAGTRHRPGRTHLEASSTPTLVATWSYSTSEGEPFDQQADGNPFWELGDLGQEDEGRSDG
jgi:hypothetical protein